MSSPGFQWVEARFHRAPAEGAMKFQSGLGLSVCGIRFRMVGIRCWELVVFGVLRSQGSWFRV